MPDIQVPAQPRGGPHCRRRGGGAARLAWSRSWWRTPSTPGPPPSRWRSSTGADLSAGDRQRLRHCRRTVPTAFLRHATSKLRTAAGPDRHRHPGLPGRGAGRHLRRVPGGTLHPHGRGRRRGPPCTWRGAPGLLEELRLPARAPPSGAGPVLQHPRPDEIHEEGLCRGGRRRRIVQKLALSHPEISFQFIRDGEGAAAHPR